MHNSYFVINKVSAFLNDKLAGWALNSCFSQQKDELVLIFTSQKSESFILRADLQTSFTCLNFPETFNRARINSIDLFGEIIGATVRSITQFNYERAFLIIFENEFSLLFKMFGNQSNIILYHKKNNFDQFKKNKKQDQIISIDDLNKSYDLAFEKFQESELNPKKFLPVIDNSFMKYLNSKGYQTLNTLEKYNLVKSTLIKIDSGNEFFIYHDSGIPLFSIFKPGDIEFTEFKSITESLNYFYRIRIYSQQFIKEKSAILNSLIRDIGKIRDYLATSKIRLDAIIDNKNYKHLADLLMANLQNIKPGSVMTNVTDFYTGSQIQISLKPGMSPQKNAEILYRKSKNQDIEIKKLNETIRLKTNQLEDLENKRIIVEKIIDLKELRKYNLNKNIRESPAKPEGPGIFRKFNFMNYEILVGKSSSNNEKLTFEYGHKNDLWLHARDVSGSHVIIKFKSGDSFPKPVIERAAELAAYFSKSRNNTLSTVIYTPRKYVRKLKGGAPGQVIVEKEEIIFVKPRL